MEFVENGEPRFPGVRPAYGSSRRPEYQWASGQVGDRGYNDEKPPFGTYPLYPSQQPRRRGHDVSLQQPSAHVVSERIGHTERISTRVQGSSRLPRTDTGPIVSDDDVRVNAGARTPRSPPAPVYQPSVVIPAYGRPSRRPQYYGSPVIRETSPPPHSAFERRRAPKPIIVHKHNERRDYADSEAEISSEEETSNHLSFDFSFSSPTREQSGDSQNDLLETTKEVVGGPFEEATKQQYLSADILKIIRSSYKGGIAARGESSAQLNIVKEKTASTKLSESSSSWTHLQHHYPSFHAYLEYVARLESISEDEKSDALALLEEARRENEMPILTPKGTSGKCMQSNLSATTTQATKFRTGDESKVLLLCIPFLHLAPYASVGPTDLSHVHPMRTLLQTSSSSTPKQRDMRQAILHLAGSRKGYCFHVPQLWCLVINRKMLITCSHLAISDIQQGSIDITLLPGSKDRTKSGEVTVYDGGNRAWCMSSDRCKTWFEFATMLKDLSPDVENVLDVREKDVLRTPSNWPNVIERSYKSAVALTIYPKRQLLPDRRVKQPEYTVNANGMLVPSRSYMRGKYDVGTQNRGRHQRAVSSVDSDLSDSDGKPIARGLKYDGECTKESRVTASDLGPPPVEQGQEPEPHSMKTEDDCQLSTDRFHVFIWLMAAQKDQSFVTRMPNDCGDKLNDTEEASNAIHPTERSNSFTIKQSALQDLFDKMHVFLQNKRNTTRKHRLVYNSCPTATLEDIEKALTAEYVDINVKRPPPPPRPRSRQTPTYEGRPGSNTNEEGNASPPRERIRSRSPHYQIPELRDTNDIDSSPRERDDSRRRARRLSSSPRHSPPERANTEGVPGINRDPRLEYSLSVHKDKKKFLRGARDLFLLFMPLHLSPVISLKYWGSVLRIIEDDDKFQMVYTRLELAFVYGVWNGCLSLAKSISSDLSDGRGPLPWNISLPNQFGEAWLHLVLTMAALSASEPDIAIEELTNVCVLLSNGRKELKNSISPGPLDYKETVLPLGIVALLVKAACRDTTHVQGLPDICSTYEEYIGDLTQQVNSNPYSRAHQEKLALVTQELECVRGVLNNQLTITSGLQTYMNDERMPSVKGCQRSYGRQEYIVGDCVDSVRARLQMVDGQIRSAEELARHNIQRIESNKDRQEAAILVFTAVTIIFLPLSFVTSFFGMNTSDIREMGTRQWIFWACAIPLTIAVVGLALLIVQKVEPLRQRWGNFLDRRIEARPGGMRREYQ